MKKILSLLLTIAAFNSGFSQSGFKPLETSKQHLYTKNYSTDFKLQAELYKGDVVYVNNLKMDENLKDPFKLKAIEDIQTVGNYVFDGKKWRAVGNNLSRQTQYLSYSPQTLPINSSNETKISFDFAKDKLFQNVTRFHESGNEFEIFYTGFHQVSGSLFFNAKRYDLIEPNNITILVKIMNGSSIINQTETVLSGKKAGEWVLINIPPKRLKLNSGDKISMVITKLNKDKNSTHSLGSGDHIGSDTSLGNFSKSITIEKL